MRKAVFSSVAILIVALGALPTNGWEHSLEDLGDGDFVSLVQSLDASEWAGLTIGCVMGSGLIGIELISQDDPVAEQMGSFTIRAGGTTYTIPATLGETDGYFLASGQMGAADSWGAVRAIYASGGAFTVEVLGESHSFPGADYGDAFGAMMDSCA